MRKTFEQIEQGEAVDALHEYRCVHEAMRYVVGDILESGGLPCQRVREGIDVMFRYHSEVLDALFDAFEAKGALLDEYRKEIEAGAKPAEVPTPKSMVLREEFVATKAREGVDAGDIAAAMNMKRASIEKIISRLKGEEAESPSTAKVANG